MTGKVMEFIAREGGGALCVQRIGPIQEPYRFPAGRHGLGRI